MMRVSLAIALALMVCVVVRGQDPKADEGFTAIFDGKSLDGWEGNPELWRVEEGALVGQTTKEKPTKGNTFLIWKGGEVGDFTLRAKFKIEGGNSGIQYRSKDMGKWVVNGYQADIDSTGRYMGILYEEGPGRRGILAERGTTVVIPAGGKPQVQKDANKAADAKEIVAKLKKDDWNDYEIVAKGNHLVQKINGMVTVDVTDEDETKRAMSGILALQLHAGPPMKVQFKEIVLKKD